MLYPSIAPPCFLLEVYFLVGHVCSLISIWSVWQWLGIPPATPAMTFDFLPKTTCVASGPKIEIWIETTSTIITQLV